MTQKVGDKNASPDKKKKGEPLKYDPNFKGPVTNRSCTDVICCIIFIIFILGFVVVSYFAFSRGDYKLLLYPMDTQKQLCGYGDLKDKPNLLFFDITRCATPAIFLMGCPTTQVCVKDCPSQSGVTPALTKPYCTPEGKCPLYVLKSKPFVGRCVPDIASLFGASVSAVQSAVNVSEVKTASKFITKVLEAKAYADKIISDVVVSWWIILIGLIVTMVVSLIWIVLMRWVAGVMVWLGIIAFLVLFGAGCGISVWKYLQVKDSTKEVSVGFNPLVFKFSEAKLFLTLCIICSILFVIFLLVLIALFSRIRIAIALIKEGSRAIGNIFSTLLWPIIPFVLHILVIVYWLAVAVCLFAISRSNDLKLNESSTDEVTSLVEKIACANETGSVKSCYVVQNMETYTLYLQIFAVFVFFWMVNFVTALGQLTLAGTFASYYWSFNKPKDIPTLPLLRSFYRCFRYHLGSLAFGSLIIAIVQMIRLFLEYVDNKLKDVDNPVAKFMMKCLKCCFWCLEKFLRFLNKNAYIMIAVHGKNFCVSAKDAFMLILRNVARTVVIDKATDFVLLMSRLVIVCGIGVASYFVFTKKLPVSTLNDTISGLNFYVVPIVVIIIGAYIITDCFFSVYEMAVDTLFLCFLEDLEKNDGSAEKPYFMNKNLMKILGKNNKVESKD